MNLQELFHTIEQETGAVVNISVIDPNFLRIRSLQLSRKDFYHHGPYCEFAKIHGNQTNCSTNKLKSYRIAEAEELFYGICPFGVWDLAKPIFFDGELRAIVYLGSFTDGTPLAPVNGVNYTGKTLPAISEEKIALLIHYAEFLGDFICLVYRKWFADGNRFKSKLGRQSYRSVITQFLEAHYQRPCQLSQLAERMSLTVNHTGGIVKKVFEKSFNQLLVEQRVEQAKVMLRAKASSVSSIAYDCGFSDSNYFSTVFKKNTGFSPREYRKSINNN